MNFSRLSLRLIINWKIKLSIKTSLPTLSLQNNNLWCTNCQTEGKTKDTYKYVDYFDHDVWKIVSDIYCDICHIAPNHTTKYCKYNLYNVKTKKCTICEDNTHSTQECLL